MYKIDKRGRKMPLRYFRTFEMRPILNHNLEEPWSSLHTKILKKAAKEILKFTKISNQDLIELDQKVYTFILNKKEETKNCSSMDLSTITNESVSEFLLLISTMIDKKLEENKKREKKSIQNQEIFKLADKEVIRIFVEAIDSILLDKEKRNQILEIVKEKITNKSAERLQLQKKETAQE